MIERLLIELAWIADAGFVNGRVKPLRGKFPAIDHELPRPFDRFLFEIIAKAPVAEHFEKSVVISVEPDVFEVVVFPAGANALLRIGDARRLPRRLLLAEKNRDELIHPCIGEKEVRRIRQERRRRHNRVLLLAEEIEKALPYFRRGHDVDLTRCSLNHEWTRMNTNT